MIHTFPFYLINCVSRSVVPVTGTNCLVECTVDLLIEFVVFRALTVGLNCYYLMTCDFP